MKYRIRTADHGPIGGISASISIDGGATWHRVRKYVGGGLCNFDSKQQAYRAADKLAAKLAVVGDRVLTP